MIPFRLFSSIFIVIVAFSYVDSAAQSQSVSDITTAVSQEQVKLNVHFLSADELRGRDTGSPEIDIAAAYIVNWFRAHGVQPAYGDSSYYQHVPFEQRSAPDVISFSVGDSIYQKESDLILLNSYLGELDGEIVYLNHATEEELTETNVDGKIIITHAGCPESGPRSSFLPLQLKKIAGQQKQVQWLSLNFTAVLQRPGPCWLIFFLEHGSKFQMMSKVQHPYLSFG